MGIRATRPHVFSLTEDEQAFLDLWAECGNKASVSAFSKALGVSPKWAYSILHRRAEIRLIEDDRIKHGVTSLGKARGAVRMKGTK